MILQEEWNILQKHYQKDFDILKQNLIKNIKLINYMANKLSLFI